MPFLSNIPQATDQLSISQGDLLNNFGILGAIAGNANANSASLNATVGFNFVNFANQGADPSTGAGQIALYAKTVGGNVDLFLRNQSNGTTIDLSLGGQAAVIGNGGYQKFPSGFIFQWDFHNNAVNGLNTFNFPLAFPNAAIQFGVTTQSNTAADTNTFVRTGSILSPSQYTVWASQRTSTNPLVGFAQFTLWAIGN
jgi:hypothetical protein